MDVILKPGREKSVLRRHPWIFSGAIQRTVGVAHPGDSVDVYSCEDMWLARGAYSHNSQISVRIWSWNQNETINNAFIHHRLHTAITARQSLHDLGDSNAYRLVHGESDGLPGLIVDRYDDIVVIQCLSAGTEHWRETIIRAIPEVTGLNKVFERSDADVRKLEGLPIKIGPVGKSIVPEKIVIREHGLLYSVNLRSGHKTGFYLDQRTNRFIARSLAEDKDILDCFCYTGGFSLNAWAGSARSILALDESSDALDLVVENQRINMATPKITLLRGDVFQLLRQFRDQRRSFDLIVLDPPKFAPTISQVDRAVRGYKDVNLLAMKLLRPRGVLMTFSCSGGVSLDLFEKVIAGAALDSKLDYQIIGRLHQGADHPVAVNFPEGTYLKGLILRRI